jgi:fucose permease
MLFALQAALEAFYGLGYIVGPMIGGILFSVSTPSSGNVKKLLPYG